MKSFLLLLSGLLISGLIFIGTSCKKETDCKVVVKCVNEATGAAMGNVKVELFALVKDPSDPTGIKTDTADVKANGISDGSGEVRFTFKLPALYDIRATTSISNGVMSGSSIIKLEVGETVSKTVPLK